MAIDSQQLAKLLDQYGPTLELFARQRCRSAADVVQEALLKLVKERKPPTNVVGWLFQVVRNGAISAARSEERRQRHERAAAERVESWFEPSPEARLDADLASQQLARLELNQREVIVAHLWGGLSFDEIAALTGLSRSSAHRHYQDGLRILRTELGVPCQPTDQTP